MKRTQIHVMDGRQSFEPNLVSIARSIVEHKESVSRSVISKLRATNRFPVDDDEIVAYLGKRGVSQKFNNIEKLFAVARSRPLRYWSPTYRFEPTVGGTPKMLLEAALFAYKRAADRVNSLRGKTRANKLRLLFLESPSSVPQIIDVGDSANLSINSASEFWILNLALLASTFEARSVEIWRTGGMVYHAAMETRRQYPSINLAYSAARLDNLRLPTTVQDSFGVVNGVGRIYAVPAIRMSLKTGRVRPLVRRPGKKIRSRRRRSR